MDSKDGFGMLIFAWYEGKELHFGTNTMLVREGSQQLSCPDGCFYLKHFELKKD